MLSMVPPSRVIKLASELLSLTPEDLEKEALENKLIEVNCNAEEEIADS